MTSIHTLTKDIHQLLSSRGWFTDVVAQDLNDNITKRLKAQYGENRVSRLRMSGLGPTCPKALWHSIHTPELAEPLPPWAEFKFSFGHIIEAMVLVLAKAAGHEVTGEGDELLLDGILGHRDAVIDGCIVDIKSSASRGMGKYKEKNETQIDDWGYLCQLDAYLGASQLDDLVRVKDKAYILAVDKTLGHMILYEHKYRHRFILERISEYKRIIKLNSPPACGCNVKTFGSSGNVALDTKASYSPWKFCCFPNLRTFIYSDGPKYLTKVERKPDVIEINRHGQIVH